MERDTDKNMDKNTDKDTDNYMDRDTNRIWNWGALLSEKNGAIVPKALYT
jgi:hypothetical protein